MLRLFPLLFVFACAFPALGQNAGPYRFDNFDTKYSSVFKEDPPQPAQPSVNSSKTVPQKQARKTASSAATHRFPKYDPFAKEPTLRMTADALQPLNPPLNLFTTGNPNIDALIRESGLRNGVDPMLVYAIMHQESAFKPRALSYKGARGLMQLMPGTAARFGVRNIFDPRENIEGGTKYLRFLLDYFDGDVTLALAGYNAGEGAVLKYGRNVPPYRETQEYVRRIGHRYRLMRDPSAARTARRLPAQQLATLQAKPASPPTVYERQVFAVRLPDGKLQLVSQ